MPLDSVQLSPNEKKILEVTSYLVDSGYRPVDWRDRVARLLKGLPAESRQSICDDKYVSSLVSFYEYIDSRLRSDQPVSIPEIGLDLSRRFKDWAFIFSLLHNTDGHNIVLDVKCHILGRASNESICQKFNWTHRQLTIFKKCFFDVDKNLNNPSYILHYAIFFKSEKYNFTDPEVRALFTCYFNGLDAFYFTRQRSSLMQYTYTKQKVEPNGENVQADFIRWKTHMILESIESPTEFAAFLKSVKDYLQDNKDARGREVDYLMANLYEALKFEMKARMDLAALTDSDVVDVALTNEVFNQRS